MGDPEYRVEEHPDGTRRVHPSRVRRAPDGRVALYFAEGPRESGPFWLEIGLQGDLYVSVKEPAEVADWAEVELPAVQP
ncbi:hypothetical protein [Saccharothrix xinjiangensis]|uniref:Uncharacterized protein n=1 Tax=Saccharothrix xinjiangensis TaxID=204798 RepID=A0ABV9XW16_9PSEU